MAVLPVGAGLSDTYGRKPILVFDNILSFLGLAANLCASLPVRTQVSPLAHFQSVLQDYLVLI